MTSDAAWLDIYESALDRIEKGGQKRSGYNEARSSLGSVTLNSR
jgi:hypothetical protein